MEIIHFSHKHPLMFKELEQKNENNRPVFCNGCSDAEIGTCYSCNQRHLLLITCFSVIRAAVLAMVLSTVIKRRPSN